jgi:hypothetical protein
MDPYRSRTARCGRTCKASCWRPAARASALTCCRHGRRSRSWWGRRGTGIMLSSSPSTRPGRCTTLTIFAGRLSCSRTHRNNQDRAAHAGRPGDARDRLGNPEHTGRRHPRGADAHECVRAVRAEPRSSWAARAGMRRDARMRFAKPSALSVSERVRRGFNYVPRSQTRGMRNSTSSSASFTSASGQMPGSRTAGGPSRASLMRRALADLP